MRAVEKFDQALVAASRLSPPAAASPSSSARRSASARSPCCPQARAPPSPLPSSEQRILLTWQANRLVPRGTLQSVNVPRGTFHASQPWQARSPPFRYVGLLASDQPFSALHCPLHVPRGTLSPFCTAFRTYPPNPHPSHSPFPIASRTPQPVTLNLSTLAAAALPLPVARSHLCLGSSPSPTKKAE